MDHVTSTCGGAVAAAAVAVLDPATWERRCVPAAQCVGLGWSALHGGRRATGAAATNAVLCSRAGCGSSDAACPAAAAAAAVGRPVVHVSAPAADLPAAGGHVHFACESLAAVPYARLVADGRGEQATVLVGAPNRRGATAAVPAGLLLRTRGGLAGLAAAAGEAAVCHCAHYYFGGACDRGEDCAFVHMVSLLAAGGAHTVGGRVPVRPLRGRVEAGGAARPVPPASVFAVAVKAVRGPAGGLALPIGVLRGDGCEDSQLDVCGHSSSGSASGATPPHAHPAAAFHFPATVVPEGPFSADDDACSTAAEDGDAAWRELEGLCDGLASDSAHRPRHYTHNPYRL